MALKFLASFVSVFLKVSAGIGITIIIARSNNAADFGIIGQYMSFASLLLMTSTLGVQAKLIKDFALGRGLIEGALEILFILSLGVSILMLLIYYFYYYGYSADLSFEIINPGFFWVFLTFVSYVLMQILLAAANGAGDVRVVALSNSVGPLIGVAIAYLIFFENMQKEFVIVFVLIFPLLKLPFLLHYLKCLVGGAQFMLGSAGLKDRFLEYGRYILMALTSAVLITIFHTFAREHISIQMNWAAAGHFQLLIKHSEVVLLIFSSFANLFLIRKISSMALNEQGTYVRSLVKILAMPLLSIYVLAVWIGPVHIDVLFGVEYGPVKGLLLPFLAGDLVRVLSYLLIIPLLVSGKTKKYLSVELFQYFLLTSSLVGSLYFTGSYQYFYLYAYITYFLVILLLFRKLYVSDRAH